LDFEQGGNMRLRILTIFLLTILMLGCCKVTTNKTFSPTSNITVNESNTTQISVKSVSHYLHKLNFREKLQRDVLSAPYNTSDYEINVFDCSNMASLLYDWLRLKGYDVKFVVAMGSNWLGHAWLLVGNLSLPDYCTNEFCVLQIRTPMGFKVTEITINDYKPSYLKLANNSYWIEPTLKLVYRNLTDVWPKSQIIEWYKIYIFPNYRDAYEYLFNLISGSFAKEFGYKWYLKEHYNTTNLTQILYVHNQQ